MRDLLRAVAGRLGGGGAGRRKPLWPFAVILLLALAFFSPFLREGKVFMAADNLLGYYPWKSFAPPGFRPHNPLITDPVNATHVGVYNRELKSGGLRAWNPYLLQGLPNTGMSSMSGAPGRFGPVKLLFNRLFDVGTAHTLVLFTHLLLMGGTMFLYLREIGAGNRGALFGAAAYMLNGYLMVWFSFENVLASSALLPLLFLAMEKLRTARNLAWACGGALVLGAIAVMGSVQFLLYTTMMIAAYALFVLARTWRAGAGPRGLLPVAAGFAVLCIGGMAISGIEILPAAEFASQSSRISRTFTFQGLFDTLSRVYGRQFVTLVFPYFFGSPVHWFNLLPRLPAQEYMNFNELCFYLGVPTLFALLACAATLRDSFARYFLFMTLLVAAMMAGTHAYYPLFKLFPGLDKTNPTRIIFVLTFYAAVAAGLGFRALEDARPAARRLFLGLAGLLAGAVAALALAGANPGVNRWFNRELFAGQGADARLLLGNLAALRGLSSPIMHKPLLLTLAAAALFALYALLREGPWRRALFGLVVALLGYDLISFGHGYATAVEPGLIYPPTPATAFLQRQPKPFRVVLDPRALLVNTMAPYGIEEVGGYSSVYPDRTNKLVSLAAFGPDALRGAAFDRWVTFNNVASPLLDLMNARYVLTAPGRVLALPHLRLVHDGDLAIYENTRALPRAFVVHRQLRLSGPDEVFRTLAAPDFPAREIVLLEEEPPATLRLPPAGAPPSPATFLEYGSDAFRLRVEPAADGWLVVSNTWYPGWEAEVDGRPARIYRADGAFQAIPLSAGAHEVRFAYRSATNRRGALLTLAGLVACAAGLLWCRRRGNAPPPAA